MDAAALPVAADWATISSVLTGVGTLVLAVATFAAVRSSSRSARIAEAALQEQRRPVLVPSRLGDPAQKLMFVDGHWLHAEGGQAAVEHIDGRVYLGVSLRNVGSGIGVCQAWTVLAGLATSHEHPVHSPGEEFRVQARDLYVPAGDVGMWQGALRDPGDELREEVATAIDAGEPISLELLYTDQIGGQRTVTRFGLLPAGDHWIASVTRHWHLDTGGPRSEEGIAAAVEVVGRERDAALSARDRREEALSERAEIEEAEEAKARAAVKEADPSR